MIKFNLTVEKKYKFDFNIEQQIKKLAKEVFSVEKLKYDFSFDVSIVGKNIIKKLNRKNRNIDKVTDVLSFPNIEFNKPCNFKKYISKGEMDVSIIDLNTKTIYLGDIVICYDKIIEQSIEYGHSVKREFSFLIVHSLLHLLGYDHENIKGEKKMFKKQKLVLDNLHIVS